MDFGSPDKGHPGRPATGRRLVALALAAAFAVALAPAARAQAPVASFEYSPASPLTGEVVTFTSTSTGTLTSLAWDFDDDGNCDDASGAVAARSFPTPGAHPVSLCVNVDAAHQKQTVSVRNRGPLAAFSSTPAFATVGEVVTLASTATDPDGSVAQHAWDLDGDGAFDDGATVVASVTFSSPGLHRVGLRVTDRDGAATAAYRSIPVAERPPELLSPFPVVRLVARVGKRGARVVSLGVRGPPGTLVSVRCRGRDCPWQRKSATQDDGELRFRRLQRLLRAGTVIEVFTTRPGSIGKYARFKIRKRRPPARVDRCVFPGVERPLRCPTGAGDSVGTAT